MKLPIFRRVQEGVGHDSIYPEIMAGRAGSDTVAAAPYPLQTRTRSSSSDGKEASNVVSGVELLGCMRNMCAGMHEVYRGSARSDLWRAV